MNIYLKVGLIIIIVLIALIIAVSLFVNMHPVFGGKHSKESISRFEKSENYSDGVFHNLEKTPVMADSANMFKNLIDFIKGVDNGTPEIVETAVFDKNKFESGSDSIVKLTWFGHSTVLMRVNGKNIITDPVFSSYASPFSFANKSFKYSNNYAIEDLPYLDAVLISHDHYDHLDYNTIKKLDKKVGKYYVPLGVESHLLRWGVAKDKIVIADWWDEFDFEGIKLISTPARHFSGRAFKRNNTLWCSWIIDNGEKKMYFGADSGYGKHFKMIGEKYGPFDLSMIECGQYNTNWPNIHAMPEQSVQASIDVNAEKMMTIHWGKFQLALHSWTEPFERAKKAAAEKNVDLIDVVIGEVNDLK